MKNLEGGLNPDHLSSERHVYGGTFELDFIPFHFRRGIRHTGTGSHIELPTMPGAGYDRSYEVSLSEWAAPMDTGVLPIGLTPKDTTSRRAWVLGCLPPHYPCGIRSQPDRQYRCYGWRERSYRR